MLSPRKPCVPSGTSAVDEVRLSTYISSGEPGQTSIFIAQAYAQGKKVPGQTYAVASNSDATKATVAAPSGAGVITRLAPGVTHVVVSVGAVSSDPLAVTVVPPTLASILLSPNIVGVLVGASAALTYVGASTFGAAVSLTSVVGEVEDTTIVSIGTPSAGAMQVTGIAAGTSRVRVKSGAIVSNWITVTVTDVPVTPPGDGGGPQTTSTVDLPTTTLTTSLASTPTGGSTIHVASGGDLQAAIDAAVPGDTITLEAGALWTGNYTFGARGGGISGAWIIVKSDGSLPPEGTRMTAANAIAYNLPKIRSTSGASPSLATNGAVSYFRFIGILIVPDLSVPAMNTIVNLGGGTETALADFPHDIILDRMYIAGHPTLECRRGVTLNDSRTAIIDGSVAEIHSTGFDSQAIWGWNGPGVYKIENNYLEASTEVIGFGGADPTYAGHNPTDIVIRRNHITRQMSWKGGPWLVKNMIELKCGIRVLIEGNVIENSWPAAQLGWVGVFWSVNQTATNPTVETAHITVRNNVIRNCAAGFQITDGYHDNGAPFVPAHHIAIYNNTFIGMDNPGISAGSGTLGLYIGAKVDYVSFEHNTFMFPSTTTATLEVILPAGQKCVNLRINNNLMGGGAYPLYTLSGSWANLTSDDSSFAGNVFGFANAAYFAGVYAMPSGNTYPNTTDELGLVGGGTAATSVNATLAMLALASDSPFKGAATDGSDPGANQTDVAAAVAGVTADF